MAEKKKEKTEKKDNAEIIEKAGTIEEKPVSKKQIEKENKILRNIFLFVGILVLVVVLGILFVKSVRSFNYNGVQFDVVQEGELIFYHTSFPVIYQGQQMDYNIYLRNDPRKLSKTVPASGTLLEIKETVINMTEEFDCEGDGIIALANLVNLYNAMGVDIMKDENASCDLEGRYMYLQILSGNETKIEMFGPNCYNLYVNNCEILDVTERFISGMLVNINNL